MSNTLQFNELGLIVPSDKILIDFKDFEELFVDSFPDSQTRRRLFQNYQKYLYDFSRDITPKFTQWVNGSFVTKEVNPNDIDFVVFIDFEIFNSKEKELENFWSFSLENEGLDAYIVKVFPPNNDLFNSITELFKEEWSKRYTHTKVDRQGQIYPKGFVEIKFDSV